MNQVGIGQLKHASRGQANGDKKMPVSKLRRTLQNPAEAAQEGQLSVDIVQREDQMIVICPIAGVEKADIRVAIQDDVLTIRGERKTIQGVELSETLVRELFWGTFSRSIILPDHIDRKNIQARVHEHMLIITIPKTEDFKSRIIHIKESDE